MIHRSANALLSHKPAVRDDRKNGLNTFYCFPLQINIDKKT